MTVASATVAEYLERLGSSSAVPGGGSAAALAGAMGAALLAMVAAISARKITDPAEKAQLLALVPELEELRGGLLRLSEEDIDAYQAVIDARKRRAPQPEIDDAYIRAAEVPLETATAADQALDRFTAVSAHAWPMTRSDLEAGKALLEVALGAALANVAVNLPDLPAQTRLRIHDAYAELASRKRC